MMNDLTRALDYFQRACTNHPQEASCHTNLSNVYVALGNFELAIQHLHQALRLNPQHVETYNNLGRLLYKQGRISEAIAALSKALRINPEYWEAHYNLAHSFAVHNQMDRSAAHYREVLRLFPEHPTAHFNLGLIYVGNQNEDLAELHLRKAWDLDQNNTEAAKQLGQIYVNQGKINEALLTYQKALHIDPTLADIHHNLAILYLRNNNQEQARLHFEQSLSLDPTNDTARHMILALTGAHTHTAPVQYVTELFDQYAEYYNGHLKTKLKYEVPAHLRNAVGQCLDKNPKAGRVLDLGCGTGLCGIVFRDLARDLIGIDLSSKMIEKATQLGAYDQLRVIEINEYLTKPHLEPFHLILAADVLVYCGDLENLFKNIKKALLPTGRFAFTIEHLKTGNYTLQPTGRFAHSTAYIHKLAAQNQFTIQRTEDICLREHEEKPVMGQIFIFYH